LYIGVDFLRLTEMFLFVRNDILTSLANVVQNEAIGEPIGLKWLVTVGRQVAYQLGQRDEYVCFKNYHFAGLCPRDRLRAGIPDSVKRIDAGQ
jgi:hypothetical protein